VALVPVRGINRQAGISDWLQICPVRAKPEGQLSKSPNGDDILKMRMIGLNHQEILRAISIVDDDNSNDFNTFRSKYIP